MIYIQNNLSEFYRTVKSYSKKDIDESGERTVYSLCAGCGNITDIKFRLLCKNGSFVCNICSMENTIKYLEPDYCNYVDINGMSYLIGFN